MFKKYQPAIIILTVLTLIIVGIVNYVQSLINQSTDSFSQNKLELLDNVAIPTEFEFKGAKIALAWTDDNTGEDLIIQSDKKEYYGFNQIDIYFSITNISKKNQEVNINFIGDRINLINLLRINNASALSAGLVESGKTNYYKATLGFPAQTKGEFFIEAKGDKGGYGYLDPWYHSNWKYRREITINSNQVATTTSAFPILATTTLTDLKTAAHGGKVENDQGYDIVWTDTDGQTILNYEQEKYASTTGEIVYWVKTDISSTTDKILYMYYGNASASDLATTTGVWDNNYVGVWHFPDNETASTSDSTQYDNDGGAVATASSTSSGWADGGFLFDGDSDYVDLGDPLSLDDIEAGDFTFACWAKLSAKGGDRCCVGWGYNGGAAIELRYDVGGDYWEFYMNSGGWQYAKYSQTHPSLDTWYHLVGIRNGDTIKVYVDGVEGNTTDTVGTVATSDLNTWSIGRLSSTVGYYRLFNGTIDEVRISNIARHAGWIETEYNNQSDVSSFMSFGNDKYHPTTQINTPITNKFKDSSLVGNWSFNGQDMDWGSSTAEALDRSGQGNNGDVIGAKAVIGKVGQGLEFDGVSNNYINIGGDATLNLSIFTVSLWVYVNIGNYQHLYGKWGDYNRRLLIQDNAGNPMLLSQFGDTNYYSSNFNYGEWVHVVHIVDSTSDSEQFYINNVAESSVDNENALDLDCGATPLWLGLTPGLTYNFDGLMDEIRIYNRALSAEEIAEQYRAGSRIMKIDPNKEYKTIIQP